jgi:hypothetical protein
MMVMDLTMLVGLFRDGKVPNISSMMPKLPNTNIFYSKWKFSQNLQANVCTWKFDLRLVKHSTNHDSFWFGNTRNKNQPIWLSNMSSLNMGENCFECHTFFFPFSIKWMFIFFLSMDPLLHIFIIMLISGMNLQ